MRTLWGALFILLSGVCARAEVTSVTSAPVVTFTATDSFSCRILYRRLDDIAKGEKALQTLLKQLKEKKKWRDYHYDRINSIVSKLSYFPVEYYEKNVRLNFSWPVNAAWAATLNSPSPLQVRWQFKGRDWKDNLGIMPDEASTQWLPAENKIVMTVALSPTELCYGPEAMQLTISETGKTDPALQLQSNVVWF